MTDKIQENAAALFDMLCRAYDAFDNEEESVKEEHCELMAAMDSLIEKVKSKTAPVDEGRIIYGIERRVFNVAEYILFKGIQDAEGIHVARHIGRDNNHFNPYYTNKQDAERALRKLGHKPFYIEQVGASRVYKAI